MQYTLILIAVLIGMIHTQRKFDERDNFGTESNERNFATQDELNRKQYYQGQQRRPTEPVTVIPIVKFDKKQSVDGSYQSEYETGNNIHAEEVGFLKDLGKNEDGEQIRSQVQQGSFSYVAPDGQIITVNYVADENGFQVQGDHLPTPPPPSEEIRKGLKLIYDGIRQKQENEEKEQRQSLKNEQQSSRRQ